MAKAKGIAPAVSHTGSVGGDDRVYEYGYFDNVSDGTAEIAVADIGKKTLFESSVTLYVRSGGLNSNATPGTKAEPFATPQGALNALAERAPGYKARLILDVGAGTFTQPSLVSSIKCDTLLFKGAGIGNTIIASRVDHGAFPCNTLEVSGLTVRSPYDMFIRPTAGKLMRLSDIELNNTLAETAYGISSGVSPLASIYISGVFKITGAFTNILTAGYGGIYSVVNAGGIDLTGITNTPTLLFATHHGTITVQGAAPNFAAGRMAKLAATRGGVITTANDALTTALVNGGSITKDVWSIITGVA